MKEKALTIKQPWAYLICAGIKDIENRTWATKFRGRVYIHTSAKRIIPPFAKTLFTLDQTKAINDFHTLYEKEQTVSAIIGHVDIVDCVINHQSIWAEKTIYPKVTDPRILTAIKPTYNWILANPVLFDKPIFNVKGKLSFWDCSQYIHSEIDEDGKPVCMCNLGIDEKDQVMSLGNEFRCNYCDGKWYK